ncbi:MAG: hypothetical protein RLZZ232_1334 [Planctomycetota bacterium]
MRRTVKSDGAVVVVKLGGSLLSLSDLHVRLRVLLSELSEQRVVIVTGGGFAADRIRMLDDRLRLSAGQCHRDAIGTMSFTAGVLVRTGTGLRLATDRSSAESIWAVGQVAVLSTAEFLGGEGRSVYASLPESWLVTSDSIAASIADFWGAELLILGKSCEPEGTSLGALSLAGMVDGWLERLPGRFRLEWCNLRNSSSHRQVIQRCTESDRGRNS